MMGASERVLVDVLIQTFNEEENLAHTLESLKGWVNKVFIVDGPTAYLEHLLLHEDRRGLEHFFAKHNRYSTLEAREIFESPEPWPGVARFITDRVTRRRVVKSRVLPYLPLPWTWRLIYMYVIRGGFLDG